ncbi:MAG: DNA polymerase III subunit gamma/tau [Robiginitomaculum sp.]
MHDKTDSSTKTATGKNYQVLARKYRPQVFEDMIGQEALVKTLTNAFETGRVAHAFMLTGVRGVGKTTTARLLARALNYESDDHSGPSVVLNPPGTHCDAINKTAHMDVMEMDAASRTGVGDIREILDSVRYAPVSARYKVYIIDEVHMLSAAAFNALLKTLEEPPDHAKFIFATTEIRKIPITVLSRCQRFDLRRIEVGPLTAHLKNICKKEGANISQAGLTLIARAAEGSVRDALSFLDQAIVHALNTDDDNEVSAEDVRSMLGLADRSRVLDLFSMAAKGDTKAALSEVRAQYADGADPVIIIRDLLDICHEVSRAKALGKDCNFDATPDMAARIFETAELLTMGQITRNWEMLLKSYADVRTAPDPLAACEMALLRLCVAGELPPPELAAQILENLKAVNALPASKQEASSGTHSPSAQSSQLLANTSPQNTAPALSLTPAPQARPKLQIESLENLVAGMLKTETQLKYDIRKFVRPITFEPGRLIFSPAPDTPANLEMRVRTYLTRATNRPWEVRQEDNEQGEPSLIELAQCRKEQRKKYEENHPVVLQAKQLFPGVIVEFRDCIPISDNVIAADFSGADSHEQGEDQ